MIQNERDTRSSHLQFVAQQMMTAARTAPKGKGVDLLEILMITGSDILHLSEAMVALSEQTGMKFLLRDAENILQSEVVVLVGSRQKSQNLNCGYCGFPTCRQRQEVAGNWSEEGHPGLYTPPNGTPVLEVPCAINSVDIGIALGSMVATAADLRVDTRVMFSVGWAAMQLNWLPVCQSAYGVPVSASSKNPFFDRQSTRPA